jgi:uncharacterized protein (TIGR02271 family)
MNSDNQRNLEQYIDHKVVDQNGDKIGTLVCLWSDTGAQPAYLGVQTGWLFGKTHVVPADRAEVNPNSQIIRLPYTTQQVKDAPSYDPGVELDSDTESQVRSYYGSYGESRDSVAAQTRKELPADAAVRTKGTRQQSANVKLHEEKVKVGKRQVEAGGVRLRKIIRTETVNQPVELHREEIVVERVPATQSGDQPGTTMFQQEDIFIPLRREEPVVQKEARVREEVRVSKKAQTERQNVSEQVRKEDVEVQRTGAAPASVKPAARQTTEPAGQASRRGTRTEQHGRRAVFGISQNEQQASDIVTQLKQNGFSSNDISVLFPDKRGTKDFAHEKNTKAPEGATTGGVSGGVLGGVLGWLVGVGALAIPGLGPFVAAGPITAALSGAAVGAGTGGLIGALVGLGMPEYEAKRYEGKLREGNILISVHSDNSDETSRAKDIFQRAGATDISTTGEQKVMDKAA